jgi:hypothetical protein
LFEHDPRKRFAFVGKPLSTFPDHALILEARNGVGTDEVRSVRNPSSNVTGVIAAIVVLATLPGWTDTRGAVRIEQAAAGKPYDFVVHVRNIPEIKYNPEVKGDRHRMALNLVKTQCPAARVVGEDKIITEIWGITSSPPDYIVLVRCARKLAVNPST